MKQTNSIEKKQIESDLKKIHTKPEKHKTKYNKKLIVIFCFVILISLFLMLPLFRITTIEIKNANFISAEKIIVHSGIKENQHFLQGLGNSFSSFFNGRYGQAEDKVLKNLPQIADITIKYSFPNTIVFDVTERIAIGWLKIPDGYCTIDSQGTVIEILNDQPENLPIIKGIKLININLGNKIEVDQSNYLENAIYTMSALVEADLDLDGKKLLNTVNVIEPTIGGNIYLHMTLDDQEILVICNKSRELKNNFIWLKQLVNSEVIADKGSGQIDIRGKTRTFKPDNPRQETEFDNNNDGGSR